MVTCETPDLGRVKSVGLFLLDDCMAPVYGTATGYLDNCPAAVETSDDVDNGDDFTRKCMDGSTKRFIPGVKSLNSIEVNLDLHWIDAEWLANAGLAEPIMFGGDVVGWADSTNDRANILVVITQEILGGDVCTSDEEPCNDWVRMYPLKGARITEDGDVGSEDNVFRITGNTVDSSALGSGPIPLMCDAGEPAWPDTCFPSGRHRYQFTGAPLPDTCGAYDTEEPDDPCTPSS